MLFLSLSSIEWSHDPFAFTGDTGACTGIFSWRADAQFRYLRGYLLRRGDLECDGNWMAGMNLTVMVGHVLNPDGREIMCSPFIHAIQNRAAMRIQRRRGW